MKIILYILALLTPTLLCGKLAMTPFTKYDDIKRRPGQRLCADLLEIEQVVEETSETRHLERMNTQDVSEQQEMAQAKKRTEEKMLADIKNMPLAKPQK